jgi:hypothetical protein
MVMRLRALSAALLLPACSPGTELKGTTSPPPARPAATASAVTLVQPAPEARAPPNLAAVVLRFPVALREDGAPPSVRLTSPGAADLQAGPAAPVPCAGDGRCYAFALPAPLSAAHYQVEAPGGASYQSGVAVPAGRAGGFTVPAGAPDDHEPPAIAQPRVEAAADCLRVRFQLGEPARAVITIRAGPGEELLGTAEVDGEGGGEVDLVGGTGRLPPGPAEVLVQAVDWAGNRAAAPPLAVEVIPSPVPLVITEVLANPAGSELTQEFVEVLVRGSEPVSTEGLSIEDAAGSDHLPVALLAPGAHALVVAAGFLLSGPDPPPAAGTVVLRVEGRIGRDGLGNGGEVVRLRDAAGRVVTQYGGWVDTSASSWSGRSVKRSAPEACDHPTSWPAHPSLPTPGE